MTNDKLHAAMAGFVERGDIPGIVTLVARGDEVQVDAVGMKLVGGSEPMREGTIFRIASLTKPIAAAATLILVDDGVLRLDDPVEPWLPELANRRVLRRIDSELDDTVPARRAITVRDLLTSCLGFGSVMAMPGTYPIQRPIADGNLGGEPPLHHAPGRGAERLADAFGDERCRPLGGELQDEATVGRHAERFSVEHHPPHRERDEPGVGPVARGRARIGRPPPALHHSPLSISVTMPPTAVPLPPLSRIAPRVSSARSVASTR